MIHTLDTREVEYKLCDQFKSTGGPQRCSNCIHYKCDHLEIDTSKKRGFLIDSLKLTVENIEELVIGDYLTYEYLRGNHSDGTPIQPTKNGHCVEIKMGTDALDWDRLEDELYRMLQWQKQNPNIVIHAVWVDTEKQYVVYIHKKRVVLSKTKIWDKFVSICSKNYVWPHRRKTEEELTKYLKKLDQPKAYQRDTVYMKRTDDPTLLPRMIRQRPRVSSEMAMKVADAQDWNEFVLACGGYKKNGKPKKIALDLMEDLLDVSARIEEMCGQGQYVE